VAARSAYYQKLKSTHIADYAPLFRRLSLKLGDDSRRDTPTDLRRQAVSKGASDPGLHALFFQYGRYLTIAGSRADSALPLALQGIWNDGLAAAMGWTDDFHLDINTEQNYWAAEVCNLSECQRPLFRFLESLRIAGQRTATEMYGAKGWVVHTVTNPWGYTAPGDVGWGHLSYGRNMDFASAMGSLRLHKRHAIPTEHRLSSPARRSRVLPVVHGDGAEPQLVGYWTF